jgi:hypothetical protein
MRRPFSPALDLSVSYTVWRGKHTQERGRKIPSLQWTVFHKYFEMKFNEFMTRRNLSEYIFLVPYKNIH